MAKTPVTAVDLIMATQTQKQTASNVKEINVAGSKAIASINRSNGLMTPAELREAASAESFDESKPWLLVKATHEEISQYLLQFNKIIHLVADKSLIPYVTDMDGYFNNCKAFEQDYIRITDKLKSLHLQHQHLTVDSPVGDNYFLPIAIGQGYQELALDTQTCLLPVAAELEQIMVKAWNARADGNQPSKAFVVDGTKVTAAPRGEIAGYVAMDDAAMQPIPTVTDVVDLNTTDTPAV